MSRPSRRPRRRGSSSWTQFLAVAGAVMLLSIWSLTAVTAANSVPATRGSSTTQSVTIAQLTPTECSSLNLTGRTSGSGVVTGTSSHDLILGSGISDTFNGRGGNDCIVGGGGADIIDGGGGSSDICIGGPDLDTFTNCETQIQ